MRLFELSIQINPYKGGTFQQSVSGLPDTDQLSYELLHPDRFQTYGFEYLPSVSAEWKRRKHT